MSDGKAENGPAKPRRRWVKPVLVVSLALNLLFIGLIAGTAWKRHNSHWRPKHVVLELSIEQMLAELPAERRATGQKILDALRSGKRPNWGKVREQRKEAVAVLTADPYVEQKFIDLLARMREIRETSRKSQHDAVVEFVSDMTVAERKRFVEIFQSNMRGPRRHRDRRK